MKVSEIKPSELQRYVDMSKAGISKYFKTNPEHITLKNNRLTGVSPSAASGFLKKYSSYKFFGPSITLFANLCGGCGKTTSLYSLSAAARRVTSTEDDPIILIDCDSQASLTYTISGKRAQQNEPILIDYIERKASLEDIVTDLGSNTYLIKSNLNSAFFDKTLNRPSEIKACMRDFYRDLFKKFGKNTKVFQDHTPQLSNLFASSVCGIFQMPEEVICNILIPIRSDDFAIQGGKYIIEEIGDLIETYSFNKNKVNIHCFFSSLDRRVSSSGEAIKKAMQDEVLQEYLSPTAIRYSSEIPKSITNGANIFTHGKKNNATEDYQDLLLYIFNQG